MKYRAEIDGLRALAVVPVILFHAGLELFSGGFVGVDVFFVISGYLITTILIEDIENDRFSIINFYERRARRILPALFFVIIACVPFAWAWLNPFDLKEFSQSLFATSLFVSNIYFYVKTGYFDVVAEQKPLLHTWSLAVEEQYYVLFPVFLILAWRFGKHRVFWMISIMSAASLVLSEWAWRHYPTANFYLAPTRAWELFAGSLSAFIVLKHGVRSNNVLSGLGLVAIVFSIVAYDKSTPFPSVYALLPIGGVVLLLLFADQRTVAAKILSLKLFIGIGLISYSVYLWHQPILAFYRVYTLSSPGYVHLAGLIALTFVLAYLSYKFVETPFRNKRRFNRNAIFAISLAGIGLFSAAGLAGHIEKGFPERNEDYLRMAQNFGLNPSCSGAALDEPACRTSEQPSVVLWGDSYAMHLGKSLARVYEQEGLAQLTLSACPPAVGWDKAERKAVITCEEFNQKVIDYLETQDHVKTVILASSSNLSTKPFTGLSTQTISRLKNAGLEVVLISPTVKNRSTEKCLNVQMRGDKQFRQCDFAFADARNKDVFAQLGDFAERLEIAYVDLSDFQCDRTTGNCVVYKDGVLLLRDEGHVTNEAITLLHPYLQERLGLAGGAR